MSRVNWRGVVRDLAILAALSGIALSVVWVGNALWEATAIVDTHRMAETPKDGSVRSMGGDGADRQSPDT